MTCDILDFRCIIVNEIIGNVALAMILMAIAYFIIASKMKLGFDTTMLLAIPFLLGMGLIIMGFAAIYAVVTIIVGILLSIWFSRLIGNR